MDTSLTHIIGFLGVAIIVAIIIRRMRLPYTVGLVLTGQGLAVAGLDTGAMLTHDFIFKIILPPLLFEAALSIRWRELRRDMLPVVVLSTLGVVITAVVVAAGMVNFLAWPIAPAVVFGVLIAATDPIAVLAMFKDTGIKGRLRLLVESESLLRCCSGLVCACSYLGTGGWQFAAKYVGRGTHPSFYDGWRHLGGNCLWRCGCGAHRTDV